MRRLLVVLAAVAGLSFVGSAAWAIPPATVAPTGGAAAYPAEGRCVDTARVLGPGACTRIGALLAADEKASADGTQVAVAVVPSTGGASIETWGTGLFNAWGVGQAGKDNGVLLVVAVEDRALRIVTGDGMRTRLPDGQASEIVGGTILPLMRAGRTSDGVLMGLDAIRAEVNGPLTAANRLAGPGVVANSYGVLNSDDAPEEDDPSGSSSGGAFLWLLVLAGIGVAAWVFSLVRGPVTDDDGSSPRRSYSSPRRSFSSSSSSRRSSSSSSRRSSGGGGRSSGGGASGRW